MRSRSDRRSMAGRAITVGLLAALLVGTPSAMADDTAPAATADSDQPAASASGKPAPPAPKMPEPKGAKRLSKEYPIWIDPVEKSVIVEGQVALREGMLEMFACTRNTKEHESIISANTKAYLVHAALLSLGAEAGHPVQFQPEYAPPTGTEIEVLVRYLDEKGKVQTAKAQDWMKDNRTGKPMAYPFVFAGSSFYTDPDTKKRYYQAEHGDFVCVANFGTAMLDIPAKSSKSNEELEFEAVTKKIPQVGAPVHLVFKPKLKKPGAGGGEQGTAPKKTEGAKPGASKKAS